MKRVLPILLYILSVLPLVAQSVRYDKFRPGTLWLDTDGRVINAHGGCVLFHSGKYYWFGEHREEFTTETLVGVSCYSSTDLLNWKNEGIALPVSKDKDSPLAVGALIERPRVVYNNKNKNFVMYFHLEPASGQRSSCMAVAVSKDIAGPYKLVKYGRINAGKWPINENVKQSPFTEQDKKMSNTKWAEGWHDAIMSGLLLRRDFYVGQQCGDMTLFLDNDGSCYHIYSSEDGLALHIAELTDDYLDYTGRYMRVDPTGQNKAPVIFKSGGLYWLFTSSSSNWRHGATRLFSAPSIWGPWEPRLSPCKGKNASKTFYSCGTYIFPVNGMPDTFIFMSDNWRHYNPIDSRYIWLPIRFKYGTPVLEWQYNWQLQGPVL